MKYTLLTLIDFYKKPNEITPTKLIKTILIVASIFTVGLILYSVSTGFYKLIGIYIYLPMMLVFYSCGVFERSHAWALQRIRRQKHFMSLKETFSPLFSDLDEEKIPDFLIEHLKVAEPNFYIGRFGEITVTSCVLSLMLQFSNNWFVLLSAIPVMFLMTFIVRHLQKKNIELVVRFVYFVCMITTTPLLYNGWNEVLT